MNKNLFNSLERVDPEFLLYPEKGLGRWGSNVDNNLISDFYHRIEKTDKLNTINNVRRKIIFKNSVNNILVQLKGLKDHIYNIDPLEDFLVPVHDDLLKTK